MALELHLELYPMSNGTLILLGNLASHALDNAIVRFPWSLEEADGFGHLRDLHCQRKLVAVLFEPYTFGLTWNEALKSVREAAPTALPIACHRFSDAIDWPQLAEGGAFHALRLPLDERELRQSFGFVWTACRQEPIKLTPRSAGKPRIRRPSHNARAAGF